jgi:tetratricopeptide (TPR) repeat protein
MMNLTQRLIAFSLVAGVLVAGAVPVVAQVEVESHIYPPGTAPDPEVVADFDRSAGFGLRYFDRNDIASAYDQFLRAEGMQPRNPVVIYNMAVLLTRMGKLAEAQQKVDLYLALYPQGEEIPRIQELQTDLNFEREEQARQQADRGYVELFNLAGFHYTKGEYDTALAHFQQAEQQRLTDGAAVYNQALVYEAMGDYARAADRLRHYLTISGSVDRSAIGQKLLELQREVEGMSSATVCSFCGHRLSSSAVWCHRCWHGPFAGSGSRWNGRTCHKGVSAVRSTFYGGGRLHQNEDLPCLFQEPSFQQGVRYSRARQRAIEEIRRNDGWVYRDGVLQGMKKSEGEEVRFVQGQHLERISSPASGGLLTFSAKRSGETWLLEREDLMIGGQFYTKSYEYDMNNRIVSETVTYLNQQACNHLVETTATYKYAGENLVAVDFKSEATGYEPEGNPSTVWEAELSFAYNDAGQIEKEEFTLNSHQKTLRKRPSEPWRSAVEQVYPSLRARRPYDVLRQGDICAIAGGRRLGNPIDLRPFYSVSPSLPAVLPFGVTRMVTSYSYPPGLEVSGQSAAGMP